MGVVKRFLLPEPILVYIPVSNGTHLFRVNSGNSDSVAIRHQKFDFKTFAAALHINYCAYVSRH